MQTANVITFCRKCDQSREITVPVDGYLAWRRGGLIQDVMATVSAEDREQLISDICPTCWYKLFPENFDE